MTKHTRRNRLITAGAVLGTAGLIFAGALPAVADESLEAPWPPVGPIFGEGNPGDTTPGDAVPGDTAPEGPPLDDAGAEGESGSSTDADTGIGEATDDDPTKITPTVSVTGWPDHTVFYAGETVTLTVHVDAGVVGAPSLEGKVAGLAYGGEALAFGEIDEEGNALVTVRPLITGTLHFTPFFIGEGAFNDATGVGGDIEVDSVPVKSEVWLDYMDDSGTAIAYGGSLHQVNATIEPFCADDENEAATDECYATYGVPTGTFALIRDGETMAEAVVEGPTNESLFADLDADLSDGARPEWNIVSFHVPSILLGSPDSFEMTAGFESDTWFTSDLAGPFTVEVVPFQPGLDLLINDTWGDEDPVRVNASEVLLSGYFQHGFREGAPLSGTIEFFANGTSIGASPIPVDEDADRVDVLWTPIEGGEYVLSAVYTPDSLNHLGSETPEYSVLVTIPPVPNPTPVDPTPADETPTVDPGVDDSAAGKSKTPPVLATTGGSWADATGVAGIGFLLAGAAALILARRKRA